MTFRIAHRLRQMVSATSLAGLAAGLAMGAASPAIASGSQAPMDAAVVRARADALIAQMTPEEQERARAGLGRHCRHGQSASPPAA